jgi:hypothetical protein
LGLGCSRLAIAWERCTALRQGHRGTESTSEVNHLSII